MMTKTQTTPSLAVPSSGGSADAADSSLEVSVVDVSSEAHVVRRRIRWSSECMEKKNGRIRSVPMKTWDGLSPKSKLVEDVFNAFYNQNNEEIKRLKRENGYFLAYVKAEFQRMIKSLKATGKAKVVSSGGGSALGIERPDCIPWLEYVIKKL